MHKKRKNKIIASVLVFSLMLSNLNIATCKNTIPESYKTTPNNQSVNKKVAFGGIFAAGVIAGGGIVAAIFGGKQSSDRAASEKQKCESIDDLKRALEKIQDTKELIYVLNHIRRYYLPAGCELISLPSGMDGQLEQTLRSQHIAGTTELLKTYDAQFDALKISEIQEEYQKELASDQKAQADLLAVQTAATSKIGKLTCERDDFEKKLSDATARRGELETENNRLALELAEQQITINQLRKAQSENESILKSLRKEQHSLYKEKTGRQFLEDRKTTERKDFESKFRPFCQSLKSFNPAEQADKTIIPEGDKDARNFIAKILGIEILPDSKDEDTSDESDIDDDIQKCLEKIAKYSDEQKPLVLDLYFELSWISYTIRTSISHNISTNMNISGYIEYLFIPETYNPNLYLHLPHSHLPPSIISWYQYFATFLKEYWGDTSTFVPSLCAIICEINGCHLPGAKVTQETFDSLNERLDKIKAHHANDETAVKLIECARGLLLEPLREKCREEKTVDTKTVETSPKKSETERKDPPAAPPIEDSKPKDSAPSTADASCDEGAAKSARYRIEKTLGTGGFGTVYLCFDTQENKKVAIKERDNGKPFNGEKINALKKALNSDHIVKIIDLIEWGGVKDGGLVMEYIDGGEPLMKAISAHQYSKDQILDLCIQLIEALEAFTKNGIFHGDLNEHINNILVDKFGNVKIIDIDGESVSFLYNAKDLNTSSAINHILSILVAADADLYQSFISGLPVGNIHISFWKDRYTQLQYEPLNYPSLQDLRKYLDNMRSELSDKK